MFFRFLYTFLRRLFYPCHHSLNDDIKQQKQTARVGHVDDKANKLHAIASLRVLLDATKEQAVAANGREPTIEEVHYTAKRFVSLFSGFPFYHRNHMGKPV